MAESERPSINNNGPTIVDVDSYENDSSYGDELSSYTESLTSSVLAYRRENGRQYHGYRDGAYLFPNDEEEMDRLDILHEMFLELLNRRLFLAPVKSPQRVIDLGTGTGIWAIDFADQNPQSEVIGCDLSPIQPTLVPPNVKFLVDDIESEWTYGNDPFDFIHARFLAASIKDFKKLLERCYRSVKPGGWVEFQDWNSHPYSNDGSTEGTWLKQYQELVIDAFEKAGYEANPGPKLEEWFRDAGFKNIRVKKFVVPYGTWPKDRHFKDIGAWNRMQAEAKGFEGTAMAVLTRYEDWKPEEVRVLCSQAREDGKKRDIHMLFDFYVVYGQRPVN
ncbi:hypothetical protein VTN31DRAFT_4908 [Thermomyces dupontii]|uniref:uncharacterized protein n=1 Tax=Talaromyces thermophilus TaxID=28565 RepID=UPI0037427E73